MSFEKDKEKKKEIQLLLVGKGMLEASLAIPGHIQVKKGKKSIGEEIIKLIQGAESYGEAMIEDDMRKLQYKELLADTRRNIEICQIADADISSLAARLAIHSIKHTAEVMQSKVITCISMAVAWGVDLLRQIAEGQEHNRLIEGAEIVVTRTKEAIDLIMKEVEQVTPSVLKDLEWREIKQNIIIQFLFNNSRDDLEYGEDEWSFDFRGRIKGLQNWWRGFTGRLKAL